MFFMPVWLVGATVVMIVVGATVVTVVVGATVVSMVVGAAVISVVTVVIGVGVTGGLWVAHPANITLAVIRTAKIRKILFLSMTEFSTSLLFTRNVLNLDRRIIKNFRMVVQNHLISLISSVVNIKTAFFHLSHPAKNYQHTV
jgi:hypothetical protein